MLLNDLICKSIKFDLNKLFYFVLYRPPQHPKLQHLKQQVNSVIHQCNKLEKLLHQIYHLSSKSGFGKIINIFCKTEIFLSILILSQYFFTLNIQSFFKSRLFLYYCYANRVFCLVSFAVHLNFKFICFSVLFYDIYL